MDEQERAELTRIADEQRAKAEAEYGQFVAAQDITFNGVLAYPAGAPVPVSNVERYGYHEHGLVVTAEEAVQRRAAAAEAARAADEAAAERHRAEVAAAGAPAPEAPAVVYEDTPMTAEPVENPPTVEPSKKSK